MKNTARFLIRKAGFTLVELLIVIALIGVLAVAVLAAINPLEQLNRARDTGMESDASQLLAAIDRYYATQEKFPWVLAPVGTSTANNDAEFGFVSAKDAGVGICGDAGCTIDGALLGQYELKSEFRNRKFIKATAEGDLLYVSKASGGSKSVYACWIPTSKAKRTQAVTEISTGSSIRGTCTPALVTDWTTLADACVICIPR